MGWCFRGMKYCFVVLCMCVIASFSALVAITMTETTKSHMRTKSTKGVDKRDIKPKTAVTTAPLSKHPHGKDFIRWIEVTHKTLNISQTLFGPNYEPCADRRSTFDSPFILDGNHICRGADPFLVIMVISVHTHIDTRETIRQTWGRAAKPGIWPKLGAINETVRLVFLLGRGDKEIKNKIIEDENITHGDIVQADFHDSYFNLTLKVVNGLRWVAEFCPTAKYILKADEDVFVHVPNLIRMLQEHTDSEKGRMFGYMAQTPAVQRSGKWAVSNETYPLYSYPDYVTGNTYVISGNIASHIFYMAGHLPYLNIEDAFVTGIVRTMIGAHVHNIIGFTFWGEERPNACEFKNDQRISSTRTDDNLKLYIWEEQKTNLIDCYRYTAVRPNNVT